MIAAAMGWIGTLGSISAYLMLSRGVWHAKSLRYSALNGLAGVLAGSASAAYGAWPSAISNLVWTAIALQSAITTLRARGALHAAGGRDDDGDPEPPPSRNQFVLAA